MRPEKKLNQNKKTYYVPYNEFLYENIEALLHANGYATDRQGIQRLLLETNPISPKIFIKVIILE